MPSPVYMGGMMEQDAQAIRVLIADSYPLFRQGLRAAIDAEPDLEVIGEADTAEELIRQATTLNADVAICDLELPDIGGMEITRRLRLVVPNLGVVLTAVEEDEERLFEAVKAGASAYILKTTSSAALLDDVRKVAHGAHLIDESVLTNPSIASKVLRQFDTLRKDAPQEVTTLFAPLSPREIEILEQVSRGQSNKQIARNLAISDQTVKNHITSILKKLAVNDRTEAVVFSLRQGWIKVDGLS